MVKNSQVKPGMLLRLTTNRSCGIDYGNIRNLIVVEAPKYGCCSPSGIVVATLGPLILKGPNDVNEILQYNPNLEVKNRKQYRDWVWVYGKDVEEI